MTALGDIRQQLAQKLVNGLEQEPYVYRTPVSATTGPAICVQLQEPRSATFNVSNRMGDEWYFRIWVMIPCQTEDDIAYDELDDLVYGPGGIRQLLHNDDALDDGTPLEVTGVREYGLLGAFNSQTWVTAQVLVTVHTQG